MMELNFIAPLNQLGYGQVGLNILKELDKVCKVNFWPIAPPNLSSQEEADLYTKCHGHVNKDSIDLTAPCIKLWHQHDMAQFAGRGLRIGFPIFELDTFTDVEKNNLRNCDYIFVCSAWAKGVVINQLPEFADKVHVIPLGVDLHDVKPKLNMDGPTKFFTCGKWEIRKGHDIIPEIFCKAFTNDDNVELYMMCDNVFLNAKETVEWKDKYLSCSLGNKITFIPRVQRHSDVINLMNMMDCGIFPARAEGWNLELLEMMALGKPVITTNYSGHTEFCNSDNAMLTNVTDTVSAYDGKWFFNQGNWADLDDINIDTMADHMITIYKRKSIYRDLTMNQAGIETGKKYTWENTANEILRQITKVY